DGCFRDPAPCGIGVATIVALREVARGDAAHAEQAGADVGADHGADLAAEEGLAAEDLAAALAQALGLSGRLDVLHDPAVGARLVSLLRVLHHPLERAP